MKHQIATDPKQSSRLIACGVDPKSADFVWMDDKPDNPRLTLRTEIIGDSNPYIVEVAWSLSRLFALFPNYIDIRNAKKLQLGMFMWNGVCHLYYGNNYVSTDVTHPCESPDPIECCVKMIEWLSADGHKLNKV